MEFFSRRGVGVKSDCSVPINFLVRFVRNKCHILNVDSWDFQRTWISCYCSLIRLLAVTSDLYADKPGWFTAASSAAVAISLTGVVPYGRGTLRTGTVLKIRASLRTFAGSECPERRSIGMLLMLNGSVQSYIHLRSDSSCVVPTRFLRFKPDENTFSSKGIFRSAVADLIGWDYEQPPSFLMFRRP